MEMTVVVERKFIDMVSLINLAYRYRQNTYWWEVVSHKFKLVGIECYRDFAVIVAGNISPISCLPSCITVIDNRITVFGIVELQGKSEVAACWFCALVDIKRYSCFLTTESQRTQSFKPMLQMCAHRDKFSCKREQS